MATSYMDAGLPTLALPLLQGIAEKKPESAPHILNLAQAYLACGDLAAARQTLDQILATNARRRRLFRCHVWICSSESSPPPKVTTKNPCSTSAKRKPPSLGCRACTTRSATFIYAPDAGPTRPALSAARSRSMAITPLPATGYRWRCFARIGRQKPLSSRSGRSVFNIIIARRISNSAQCSLARVAGASCASLRNRSHHEAGRSGGASVSDPAVWKTR